MAAINDGVIYSDPTPGQRITELYCWIATYQDGSEGIIAGGADANTVRPLITSRRDLALKLAPLAERAARATARYIGHRVSVRLVTFAREIS